MISVGAGILLNKDGWVLTAKHVLEEAAKVLAEEARSRAWESIKGDHSLSSKARQRALRNVGKRPKIKRAAVMWGQVGADVDETHVHNDIDLALFRIANLTLGREFTPPKFRDGEIPAGEMLCRSGFALLEDKLVVKWDDKERTFAANAMPPLFANSGIVSRFIDDGGVQIIEVDSPGLKGQSGGPLFDEQGRICGMQFRTTHYPLGFNTRAPEFYHVGQALHASTICRCLDERGVTYAT